jgi:hypothetical protein
MSKELKIYSILDKIKNFILCDSGCPVYPCVFLPRSLITLSVGYPSMMNLSLSTSSFEQSTRPNRIDSILDNSLAAPSK